MPLLDSLQSRLPDYPRALGMVYLEASSDRLVAEITVREDMSNGNGTIHGGALMTFADTLGAVATYLNIPRDQGTTTLESKTNFGKIIVHGHTPASEPEVKHNRIGIDTGAYMSGKLTALVLEGTERQFLYSN